MDSQLRHDLTCPITLELFVDPVTVPCCGKAFERNALIETFEEADEGGAGGPVRRCPLCNGDLTVFDARTAAKNVLLVGLISTLCSNEIESAVSEQQKSREHHWTCTATPIVGSSSVCELSLNLENAYFKTRPALFVAVVDRSGSMGGSPERQVAAALKHIESLAAHNSQVLLVMLSYGSDCFEIKRSSEYVINGGTNFRAAFQGVDKVLSRYICSDAVEDATLPNNVSSATVAFMTDGQDCSGNRKTLIPEFREMLRNRWADSPLVVHSVGFSGGCDRELLEQIRTSGNIEGLYRYAEPGDDADALCQKLSSIFELSSNASSVPLTMTLKTDYGGNDGKDEDADDNEENDNDDTVVYDVRFAVNAMRHGSYTRWVDLSRKQLQVCVDTALDDNVVVPITVKPPSEFVMQRWISHLVDEMASEILELSKQALSANIRVLSCALLMQKISAIRCKTHEDAVLQRLDYLETQVEDLQIGRQVNAGKLSDLRFASLFDGSATNQKKQQTTGGLGLVSTQTLVASNKVLDNKPYFERPLKRYLRNNDGLGRNALQRAISDSVSDCLPDGLQDLIANSSRDDVLHVDRDGNNAIMLAAYCGHSKALKALLDMHGSTIDVDLFNPDNESAVTLAIKKRGFHHTLGVLLDAGATIPRTKSLERYAIENGFTITAKVVALYGDSSVDVDVSMTPDYILYVFERAKNGKADAWNVQKFLDVALARKMLPLATTLIKEHGAVPTIDMLVEHCIPKKPDSPETPFYLELASLVLDAVPDLIKALTEPDRESALLKAAQKGSLPHVQLFLSRGAVIDEPNHKGNTPLWVAAFMRYPCIIDALLDAGADINWKNTKGNPPLYGPCTRGGVKVAEQLVARGADFEHTNSNGDTLVLICCRNGQHQVLEFLLSYVDEQFVDRKAHIDGFNAVMASAEQDKSKCLTVLRAYGTDLNQKTDADNAILALATPLHIACYYDRGRAARTLLELSADPNVQDRNGHTPMHIAVIQGNVDIIRLLRTSGADLSTKDQAGNVPMAYARDREQVRKALIDPVLDVLMKLAKGGFDRDEEQQACEILGKHAGVIGCLETREVVDVKDYDGSTPLMQAVIHGKTKIVQTLVTLRANARIANVYGMDSVAWATWTRNARIRKLLASTSSSASLRLTTNGEDDSASPTLQRLKVATSDSQSFQMLFLGLCPSRYVARLQSGIDERMEEFINTPMLLSADDNDDRSFDELLKLESGSWTPQKFDQDKAFEEHREELSHRVWDAKIFSINKIASGTTKLAAGEVMAVCLATNCPRIYSAINTAILTNTLTNCEGVVRSCAQTLYAAVQNLPKYVGEAYIGSSRAQRKMYTIGQVFQWKHFASASTLWKVALENAPSFAAKSRRGIVFIIKSKNGRLVGPHSQFSFDSEVFFLPGTTFCVKNWYHGDVIALGQENIREHTFGVKEVDDERAPLSQLMQSDKSLIIELVEQ